MYKSTRKCKLGKVKWVENWNIWIIQGWMLAVLLSTELVSPLILKNSFPVLMFPKLVILHVTTLINNCQVKRNIFYFMRQYLHKRYD